jgi:hypothetical protein
VSPKKPRLVDKIGLVNVDVNNNNNNVYTSNHDNDCEQIDGDEWGSHTDQPDVNKMEHIVNKNNVYSKQPVGENIFENDAWMSYEGDAIEIIHTSRGTFRWPLSSSPQKTQRILDAFGLPHCPLNPEAWKYYLRDYPDQVLVQQVLRGIKEGFPLGTRVHEKIFSRKEGS